MKGNIHGWLLSLGAEPSEVRFLGRTWRGGIAAAMQLREATINHSEGFLADRIEIVHSDGRPRQGFCFSAEWTLCARELAIRLKEDSELVSGAASSSSLQIPNSLS